MKIAIISIYLPSGSKIGVGYQVHGLANSLVQRGHDVTVFSPCSTPEGAAYLVHVVPERKPLSSFRFGWDLRREDFGSFDVLNAHGDDWFLWGKSRPRHIHTYHGSMFAEMIHSERFKDKLRMAALAICEQQSIFLPDESVAVSENTRRYIKGIRHVIPCGVNIDRFSPRGGRADRPTILFVGSLPGRKRGWWLIEIFVREIRTRLPDAELWCVCDCPPGYAAPPGIKFCGRVDDASLADLYRKAWIFCMPSTYEGFGVPYIEALASGTPVVATCNVGASEVLDNGRWGVVCDDDAMPNEIVGLLNDADRRERLGSAGLARARDFSWDRVCSLYEALYSKGFSCERN